MMLIFCALPGLIYGYCRFRIKFTYSLAECRKDAVFLMFFPNYTWRLFAYSFNQTVNCQLLLFAGSHVFQCDCAIFHFVLTDYSHKWDVQSIGIAHLFFIFAGSGYISAEIPAERRAFIIFSDAMDSEWPKLTNIIRVPV